MADPRQSELLDPIECDALDLLLEHHQDLPTTERWPPLLRQLVDVLASYNERVLRMTPKQAADDAVERVVLLADYLGGRFVYLPRGDRLRVAARDALIYRLSERLPIHEIARLYGLSEVMTYRIVATQRAIEVDRMQGKLFEDGRRPDEAARPAGGGVKHRQPEPGSETSAG